RDRRGDLAALLTATRGQVDRRAQRVPAEEHGRAADDLEPLYGLEGNQVEVHFLYSGLVDPDAVQEDAHALRQPRHRRHHESPDGDGRLEGIALLVLEGHPRQTPDRIREHPLLRRTDLVSFEEVDGPWHPGPRQLLGERRRCRDPNGWQFDDTLLPGWTVGALDEARAAENRQENESGAGESTRSPRVKGTPRLRHALDGHALAAWRSGSRAGGDRPGVAQRRPRHGNEATLIPQPTQDAASLSFQLGQRLHSRGRLDHAAGQLRMLRPAQPLAMALDGLDHEQIRHGLV